MDNQTKNNEAFALALNESKEQFTALMTKAKSLDIVNNVAGAFDAASIVVKLTDVLSEDIMKAVFMPLQNKKIGFLTDNKDGYSISAVRDCIIDAAALGLMPTGNQFNILVGRMYPTKEGYTALLKRLSTTMGLHYIFEFDNETIGKSSNPDVMAIPCIIKYKTNEQPDGAAFRYVASVQKRNGATLDNLRGKAERKCKKAFYEFLTGNDFGDGDPDSKTIDVAYTEVEEKPQTPVEKARAMAEKVKAKNDTKQADPAEARQQELDAQADKFFGEQTSIV